MHFGRKVLKFHTIKKTRGRKEINVKINLKLQDVRMHTGFNWLRIGSRSRLL